MLKLMGAILIIGASSALGIAMRQRMSVRIRVLSEWIDCINLLILEICGQGASLHETFRRLSNGQSRLLAPFFRELTKQIGGMPEEDFCTIWKNTMTAFAEGWGLDEDEQASIQGISEYLGRYDAAAQSRCLNTAILRVQNHRDRAAQELMSKNALYRTCGAAVGIMLVLILL